MVLLRTEETVFPLFLFHFLHPEHFFSSFYLNRAASTYFRRPMGMQQMMDISSTTAIRAHPEGKSLVLAVLLQDTVLDLHYDSVFDACPICSCNGNIRAKVGLDVRQQLLQCSFLQ